MITPDEFIENAVRELEAQASDKAPALSPRGPTVRIIVERSKGERDEHEFERSDIRLAAQAAHNALTGAGLALCSGRQCRRPHLDDTVPAGVPAPPGSTRPVWRPVGGGPVGSAASTISRGSIERLWLHPDCNSLVWSVASPDDCSVVLCTTERPWRMLFLHAAK